MKNLLIAANWKSNMTKLEAKKWLEEFSLSGSSEQLEVVVLPPFTLLDNVSGYIRVNDLPLKLGSQNISPFDAGAYTGEVYAKQIKEFADYVLIGHSERRSNFSETDEMVDKKIGMAISSGLIPIVCISSLDQVKNITSENIITAYEPIGAIGTGNAEDPASVSSFAQEIKKLKNAKILYGGSVNADNIRNYTKLPEIDGVLVGGASLTAPSFLNLVKNAV